MPLVPWPSPPLTRYVSSSTHTVLDSFRLPCCRAWSPGCFQSLKLGFVWLISQGKPSQQHFHPSPASWKGFCTSEEKCLSPTEGMGSQSDFMTLPPEGSSFDSNYTIHVSHAMSECDACCHMHVYCQEYAGTCRQPIPEVWGTAVT